MKRREEAARFIEALLYDYNFEVPPIPDLNLRNRAASAAKRKSPHHFGVVELRHLMDFIYGAGHTPSESVHCHGDYLKAKRES